MPAGAQPSLHHRLSQLTYVKACKLLGPNGAALIAAGAKFELDLTTDVVLTERELRVTMASLPRNIVVSIKPAAERRGALELVCRACGSSCEHLGAVVSLVLEEKLALGLAVPPAEQKAPEDMDDRELELWAISQRLAKARSEKMLIKGWRENTPWTDYAVTNVASGKTYRVALRGLARGESYCSCPDFKTNTLGTCKHILGVEAKTKARFAAAALQRPYRRTRISLHLHYGKTRELWLRLPPTLPPAVAKVVGPWLTRPVDDPQALVAALSKLEALGQPVAVYPDAEAYLQAWLRQRHLEHAVRDIRQNPATHPLRESLLHVALLPYQLDGIAFLVGAGRAVLADDMGLGKTIQAIGAAELLAREAGIRKVLVVCPASVKAQWRGEATRFCDREAQVVAGGTKARAQQ